MNLVLIGFKSCGKSTVGRALAALRGQAFIDTDSLLEDRYAALHGEALSCREILARHGEAALRRLESDVLASLAGMKDSVIATGGGAVLDPANRALLRAAGLCLFLDTSPAELERRLRFVNSPLFATRSLTDIHAERLPLYCETAHLRLELRPGEAPARIAEQIEALIAAQSLVRNHTQNPIQNQQPAARPDPLQETHHGQ